MAGWKILLYTSLSKEMRLPSFSNQVSYKSTIIFWMLDDFTECNKWSVPYVYYTLSQLSWVWSLHHRVDRPFAGTPRNVSMILIVLKNGRYSESERFTKEYRCGFFYVAFPKWNLPTLFLVLHWPLGASQVSNSQLGDNVAHSPGIQRYGPRFQHTEKLPATAGAWRLNQARLSPTATWATLGFSW